MGSWGVVLTFFNLGTAANSRIRVNTLYRIEVRVLLGRHASSADGAPLLARPRVVAGLEAERVRGRAHNLFEAQCSNIVLVREMY